MAPQKSLKIEVSNFGPVKAGEFDLKPLTIFIGPNNSGKSYMALLVYALTKALVVRRQVGADFAILRPQPGSYPDLKQWLATLPGGDLTTAVPLPRSVQPTLQPVQQEFSDKLVEEVDESLREYFGCEDVRELLHRDNGAHALSVRAVGTEKHVLLLTIGVAAAGSGPVVQVAAVDPRSYRLRFGDRSYARPLIRSLEGRSDDLEHDRAVALVADEIIQDSWLELLRQNAFPGGESYYLPSARSGILQGWQLLASMALQIARRGVGLRGFDAPRLSGVAGDFLQILWEKLAPIRGQRRGHEAMLPALQLLEGRVFHGHVALAEAQAEQPLILYQAGGLQVPLHRASSMVAELAPLDLWLKYLLAPGDLLVIDEPEAHLHPENQRLMARVLVRLVKAGVQIICPTHSSLILHQVSNLILASQLSAAERQRQHLDLTDDDLISAADVGVYLFGVEEDGTHIQPVSIDTEFGISEEEFVRVAEAIGDETYRLSLAAVDGTDSGG